MDDILNEIKNIVPINEPYQKRHSISASSIGMCPRKILVEACGYKIKKSPDSLRIMAMSEAMHKIIQKSAENISDKIQTEVQINDEINDIGGRIDILILD